MRVKEKRFTFFSKSFDNKFINLSQNNTKIKS